MRLRNKTSIFFFTSNFYHDSCRFQSNILLVSAIFTVEWHNWYTSIENKHFNIESCLHCYSTLEDHLCNVWLSVAQRFQRRRLFNTWGPSLQGLVKCGLTVSEEKVFNRFFVKISLICQFSSKINNTKCWRKPVAYICHTTYKNVATTGIQIWVIWLETVALLPLY